MALLHSSHVVNLIFQKYIIIQMAKFCQLEVKIICKTTLHIEAGLPFI